MIGMNRGDAPITASQTVRLTRQRSDCSGEGACWVFVRERFTQFMYGFYPAELRWLPVKSACSRVQSSSGGTISHSR